MRAQWKRALVKYCVCDVTCAIVLRVHKRDENGSHLAKGIILLFSCRRRLFIAASACNGLVYRLGNLTTFILHGQLGFYFMLKNVFVYSFVCSKDKFLLQATQGVERTFQSSLQERNYIDAPWTKKYAV